MKPLQVYIALRGSGPSPHIFKKKLLAEGQCVKNPGEELAPSSLVSPIKFSQPLQVYIALRGSGAVTLEHEIKVEFSVGQDVH